MIFFKAVYLIRLIMTISLRQLGHDVLAVGNLTVGVTEASLRWPLNPKEPLVVYRSCQHGTILSAVDNQDLHQASKKALSTCQAPSWHMPSTVR